MAPVPPPPLPNSLSDSSMEFLTFNVVATSDAIPMPASYRCGFTIKAFSAFQQEPPSRLSGDFTEKEAQERSSDPEMDHSMHRSPVE